MDNVILQNFENSHLSSLERERKRREKRKWEVNGKPQENSKNTFAKSLGDGPTDQPTEKGRDQRTV